MYTHPYIHFQGNCSEAMSAYAAIFDGTELQLMPYAQMPGGDPREGAETRIMHAQLKIGEGTLMASDFPPGVEGDPQKGVSIMQVAKTVDVAKVWFDKLCDGGAMIHPFGPTFFSPGFGMVKDRFGTHWIISSIA